MRLHSLSMPMWAAMLGIAVTNGLPATAIEEVVVYATAQPIVDTPARADLQRDMSAYVDALYAEQKARIDAALSNRRSAEIQIAAAKVPTRG